MITIRKLYNWVCNCFGLPPRPGSDLTNDCYGPNATGAGENPLMGRICSRPSEITFPYIQSVDPPKCYTGDSTPCDPMPAIWRVTFPCDVPGSTCNTSGGGGSRPCCNTQCAHFLGFTNGCTRLAAVIELTLLSPYTPPCTWEGTSDSPGMRDGVLIRLDYGQVSVHDPDPPMYHVFIRVACVPGNPVLDKIAIYDFPGGEGCNRVFTFRSCTNSDPSDWQDNIHVVSCSGDTGTGTGTGTGTDRRCPDATMFVTPSGPAGVIPPYQACPSCWDLTVGGISGGFGTASEACCNSLNGDFKLCYIPSLSTGNVLTYGTGCTNSTVTGTSPVCGPLANDSNRRMWQAEYDKTLQKWRLFSFNYINTPVYELDDANPCVGDKELTLVTPSGSSGCESAPATVTLRFPMNCLTCPEYTEPGCQLLLVRSCGKTGYAIRSSATASADVTKDAICGPTRGHGIETCCDVDCQYFYDFSNPDGHCCPIQGQRFVGNFDPWFDNNGSIDVWKLDLDVIPPTLTGTFIEGEIVYQVDTNGLQCQGVTGLIKYSSSLPDALDQRFPSNACMVPDTLLTCNVRTTAGTGTFSTDDFTSCKSAGYINWETGQQEFCDCHDTCNPSVLGIIFSGECVVPVCATRTNAAPKDPLHKTKYPRIGCAQFWDGTKFNVLTLVAYCVGPANRWACDYYCTEGIIGENPRNCTACTAFVGDFLGTTYANKLECETLPVFPPPPDGVGKCTCGPIVCCANTVADTLHGTWEYGVSSPCSPPCAPVVSVWNRVAGVWSTSATVCGFSLTATLSCTADAWTCQLFTNCHGYSDVGIVQSITCSPLELVFGWSFVPLGGDCCDTPSNPHVGKGMIVTITL